MSAKIYKWRRHLNGDPQAVGEWLESLPDLSAETIVKEARKKRSPAHGVFEWSDSAAAHQFRLVQARVMVNSIHVEVLSVKQEPTYVNAFIESSDRGKYVGVFDATDEELTAAEQKFLDAIQRLESRYRGLEIAHPVIVAIGQVKKSASRKRRSAA